MIEYLPDHFAQELKPRFGRANPEAMSYESWEFMVRHEYTPGWVRSHVPPGTFVPSPIWSFVRYGRSRTELPDGRVVHVGGEHEDWYDEDFWIYNDVIVRLPDERIEIFGYPRPVFTPTDSHSAKLVGHTIVLIASIGYPRDRDPGRTPVYQLNCHTYAIESIDTGRPNPGWLSEHTAELSADATVIRIWGGERLEIHGGAHELRDNRHRHELNLKTFRWKRTD